MAHKVILPKLGTNIEKARVISWLKKEGDALAKGDSLVEVQTEKASFVLE